jgi:hypothetical protein
LLPNPPPVKYDTTRTFSGGMANARAMLFLTLKMPCVES